MAHIMYALRLINFKNFSRHQKKHLQQHKMALVISLSYFFSFWSTYSSIMRINRHMVMIKEPKARVPMWYLSTLQVASSTAKNGRFDFRNVQYQVANTEAKIIWPRAETKKDPQRKASRLNAKRKFSICVCKSCASLPCKYGYSTGLFIAINLHVTFEHKLYWSVIQS
jgi:hypothetical protein